MSADFSSMMRSKELTRQSESSLSNSEERLSLEQEIFRSQVSEVSATLQQGSNAAANLHRAMTLDSGTARPDSATMNTAAAFQNAAISQGNPEVASTAPAQGTATTESAALTQTRQLMETMWNDIQLQKLHSSLKSAFTVQITSPDGSTTTISASLSATGQWKLDLAQYDDLSSVIAPNLSGQQALEYKVASSELDFALLVADLDAHLRNNLSGISIHTAEAE